MSREIDALIAEHVMKWKWEKFDGDICLFGPKINNVRASYWPNRNQCPAEVGDPWGMPGYSTDIAAAWQVVEKMEQIGFSLGLWYIHSKQVAACFQEYVAGDYVSFVPLPEDLIVETSSMKSTAMAICKAALKVHGVKS